MSHRTISRRDKRTDQHSSSEESWESVPDQQIVTVVHQEMVADADRALSTFKADITGAIRILSRINESLEQNTPSQDLLLNMISMQYPMVIGYDSQSSIKTIKQNCMDLITQVAQEIDHFIDKAETFGHKPVVSAFKKRRHEDICVSDMASSASVSAASFD